MEAIGNIAVLKQLGNFGVIGLIMFLWWYDQRCIRKILGQYAQDMKDQRKMYESNVSLCKDYDEVSKDLKSIVILNTQVMTRLCDRLEVK